jgi:hypothetical protein
MTGSLDEIGIPVQVQQKKCSTNWGGRWIVCFMEVDQLSVDQLSVDQLSVDQLRWSRKFCLWYEVDWRHFRKLITYFLLLDFDDYTAIKLFFWNYWSYWSTLKSLQLPKQILSFHNLKKFSLGIFFIQATMSKIGEKNAFLIQSFTFWNYNYNASGVEG